VNVSSGTGLLGLSQIKGRYTVVVVVVVDGAVIESVKMPVA